MFWWIYKSTAWAQEYINALQNTEKNINHSTFANARFDLIHSNPAVWYFCNTVLKYTLASPRNHKYIIYKSSLAKSAIPS